MKAERLQSNNPSASSCLRIYLWQAEETHSHTYTYLICILQNKLGSLILETFSLVTSTRHMLAPFPTVWNWPRPPSERSAAFCTVRVVKLGTNMINKTQGQSTMLSYGDVHGASHLPYWHVNLRVFSHIVIILFRLSCLHLYLGRSTEIPYMFTNKLQTCIYKHDHTLFNFWSIGYN